MFGYAPVYGSEMGQGEPRVVDNKVGGGGESACPSPPHREVDAEAARARGQQEEPGVGVRVEVLDVALPLLRQRLTQFDNVNRIAGV